MQGAVGYLQDRLREPGSMRSLCVVLFALRGQVIDAQLLGAMVDVAIIALGAVSFLRPERGGRGP